MCFWPTEIKDDLLTIRPWKEGDAPRLARLLDHPMIYDMSPYGPSKVRVDLLEAELSAQIQSDRQIRFVVVPRSIGDIVGTIGCQKIDENRLELGFWTGAAFWGQGYTKRALTNIVCHAIQSGEFQRIEARCFERNRTSAHLLHVAGFRLEGRVPNFVLYGRPPESLLNFGIDCAQVESFPLERQAAIR